MKKTYQGKDGSRQRGAADAKTPGDCKNPLVWYFPETKGDQHGWTRERVRELRMETGR